MYLFLFLLNVQSSTSYLTLLSTLLIKKVLFSLFHPGVGSPVSKQHLFFPREPDSARLCWSRSLPHFRVPNIFILTVMTAPYGSRAFNFLQSSPLPTPTHPRHSSAFVIPSSPHHHSVDIQCGFASSSERAINLHRNWSYRIHASRPIRLPIIRPRHDLPVIMFPAMERGD